VSLLSATEPLKRLKGVQKQTRDCTMSEFLYIYRGGHRDQRKLSPEDMQQVMQKWMTWMQGLAEKGHLKERGHPLEPDGKVVNGNGKNVTDGPYAEKDLVGGYSLIEAKDLAQAAELSKGCPVLERGGAVEVRAIMKM
jgi:hypothetical protein